ncbi:MAG: DUF4286 family protein [Culturomica sp.]|jgi:hypothetical protein|nr:DUF4286 family protein [Culturomica sp.]
MRIVYNTTYVIEEAAEQEWIGFVRGEHLRQIRATGLTEDLLFTRVSTDQPEGSNYSLQLLFRGEENLRAFTERHLPSLRERMEALYGKHYLCFSSILTEL